MDGRCEAGNGRSNGWRFITRERNLLLRGRINKIGDIEETSDRVWDSIIISNPRDFHNLLFSG